MYAHNLHQLMPERSFGLDASNAWSIELTTQSSAVNLAAPPPPPIISLTYAVQHRTCTLIAVTADFKLQFAEFCPDYSHSEERSDVLWQSFKSHAMRDLFALSTFNPCAVAALPFVSDSSDGGCISFVAATADAQQQLVLLRAVHGLTSDGLTHVKVVASCPRPDLSGTTTPAITTSSDRQSGPRPELDVHPTLDGSDQFVVIHSGRQSGPAVYIVSQGGIEPVAALDVPRSLSARLGVAFVRR